VSVGGGLGIEAALPSRFAISADFRYEQGTAEAASLGDVAIQSASASLLGLIRPLVGWSSVSVGLGAKIGVGWVEGVPDGESRRGATQTGLIAGPVVAGQVALHLAGSGYLHVGLELGWITLQVRGIDASTGADVAGIGGAQLAVTAGFEIQPSR
jgi:hypothetical protein